MVDRPDQLRTTFRDGGELNTYNKAAQAIREIVNTAESRSVVSGAEYGMVGDGQTENAAAFEAACDALPGGGVLFVPPGNYIINGAQPRADIIVHGSGVGSFGSPFNSGTRFTCNSDTMFLFPSDKGFFTSAGFQNISFLSNNSGGHIFDIQAVMANCTFRDVEFHTYDSGHSVLNCQGEFFGNVFDRFRMHYEKSNTVPAFNVAVSGTINNNIFRDAIIQQNGGNVTGGTYAFFFDIVSGQTECLTTVFDNITLEEIGGGFVSMRGAKHCALKYVVLYDFTQDGNNPLVRFGKTSGFGQGSQQNLLEGCRFDVGYNTEAAPALQYEDSIGMTEVLLMNSFVNTSDAQTQLLNSTIVTDYST